MRKLVVLLAMLGTIILLGGCASVSPPQIGSAELAVAKQTVKIYDVAPAYGNPIEQISATACDGTQEAATDKLMLLASQRGGNGIAQLSCKSEGMSFSCWSSSTCTATALNVVEPPPPPPPPPKKKLKPKAKPKPKKP